MNLTKERLILLNHALNCMVVAESQGVMQGGIEALKKGDAAAVVTGRLMLATELAADIQVEYNRLIDEENAAAEAEKAKAQVKAPLDNGGSGGRGTR